MGFERKDLRLIPNSLDLAHSAQEPGRGALTLRNWRSDREGRLMVRDGHATLFAIPSANVHSIYLSQGSQRYIGASDSLFRDTTIVIGGSLDGQPLFPVFARGFVWITNRNGIYKDTGTGTSLDWWRPAPPAGMTATASSTDGNLSGTIEYYVSFSDAYEHETNVTGPATVEVASKQVNLTGIPTASWATKRHIYRIGGGLEDAYRVATLNGTDTTYTDNAANDQVIVNSLGRVAKDDHGAPPRAAGLCLHMGRLLLWSWADMDCGIAWTPVTEYWYVRPGDQTAVGDWGERILRCTSKGNVLCIYKQRSIYRAVGDLDGLDGVVERVHADVAIAGPKAIAEYGAVDFILTYTGVYRFNVDHLEKISGPIDPIFHGVFVETGENLSLLPINFTYIANSCLEVFNERLYVSYPSVGPLPDQTAIYDIKTGGWSSDSRGFSALLNEAVRFVGAQGPQMLSLEDGSTDAGTAIRAVFQTGFHDLGYPDNPKEITDITIAHNLRGKTLALRARFDSNVNGGSVSLGSVTSSAYKRDSIDMGQRECSTISVIGDGADLSASVRPEVYDIVVKYRVLPKYTVVWWSDLFVGEKLMQANAVKVMVNPAANTEFRVEVHADGAQGGELVSVFAQDISVSADPSQRIYPSGIPLLPFGRQFRVRVSSSLPIQVYGAWLNMREVAAVLEGSRAEFYLFEDSNGAA